MTSGGASTRLGLLGQWASWVYGRVIAARNRRYDVHGGRRLDVPVISVGNVTVGGTGKTPFVRYVAELLQGWGYPVVIAMRGYRSRGGMSDEEAEHGEALTGVEVVAHRNRFEALEAHLRGRGDGPCVILDDGFQHRQLHRDLDVVLVSAREDLAGARLLPAGSLREPPENLRRADAVIVTHAEEVDSKVGETIGRYHGRGPAAWARHVWRGLRVFTGGGEEEASPRWLRGKRVVTLLGVARPEVVLAQLRGAGAEVAGKVGAQDHERYSRRKLRRVREASAGVDALVMTGKDWVKVRELIDLRDWGGRIVVPEVSIEVFEGGEAVKALVWGAVGGRVKEEGEGGSMSGSSDGGD